MSYQAASFWTPALRPPTSALLPSSPAALGFPSVKPLLGVAYVAAGALLVLALIGLTVIAWYGITMIHD